MEKKMVINTLISTIAGGLIGGTITYITVKKTFAKRAQADIDDVKQAYAEMYENDKKRPIYGDMPGPDKADILVETPAGTITAEQLRQAEEFVQQLGYQTTTPAEGTEPTIVNIYNRVEDENPGEEVESPLLIGYDRDERRKEHRPYLISHDEFINTNTEWDKMSLTYYEDDDVLTDEGDMPIDNVDYLIDDIHLNFFGLRSGGDKNMVFVRNGQLSSDYEIIRNLGSYTEIVLNIPRDSDKVGTRRMRRGDDD